MTVWQPYDFGYPLAGRSGLIATGNSQATAQPLTTKINVFQNVAPGTGCILPTSYSPGSEPHTLNRGANPLLIYPGQGDQIENNGVNVPMTINVGGTFVCVSFDAPLAHQPRTWWLDVGVNTSGGPAPPGGDGLGNDQGVLLLLNATGWPTSSGAPGSLYNLGGTIGCSGPTTPNPSAQPVVFGFITSVALLALGGANLPTTSPAVGSNIIWNQGGLLCVA